MSVWTRRPALRWLVPVTVAALMVGGAAAGAIAAVTEPKLPPRSAAELLVDLQTAEVAGLSGTVVHTAELGLPALPATRGHGSADLGSLWSGSSTLRVWYAGPEQTRVALLGTLGQSDIIRNGQDLWVWESSENRASHWRLPEPDQRPAPSHLPPMTPQQAADLALAALAPTTEVTTGNTARVAGRDAYELVLAPRDAGSLIREIRLAIDAEHGIPLGVQVFGTESDPAVDVRFTQISFAAPDPAQFRFNPPPGATVTEDAPPAGLPHGALGEIDWPAATTVGQGWSTVLVARLPELANQRELEWLLQSLPTVSGDWGTGQVVGSHLFSVLITEDGRVLIGAVTPERLVEVAGDPAAALADE
jgi:outer membrane lipoprotein-sorting protein